MSFFYSFLHTDYPVSSTFVDIYDLIQFYFFTNSWSYNYIYDLQIFVRFSLKMEYQYTDFINPIELEILFTKAEKLEEEKKKQLEESNKSNTSDQYN